ncbi:hypothetical protein [Salinimicrobium oceani]|nr:hypothetical protein [Salinimicrobium oceani]
METGKTNKDLLKILVGCATECDICFDASLDNEKTGTLVRVV